jgi:flavin reductase (DIM6/NTAB) family NADH-FMN oxidoreductase RutF
VNGPGRTGVAGLTPDRQRADGAPPDGTRAGVANLTAISGRTAGAGLMPPPRPRTEPGKGAPAAPAGPAGVAKLTPAARATAEAGKALRQVMGRFATGVTVVTTADGDAIHGMTANAFLSVSLTPPLVLISLGRCRMAEMLPRTGRYGVSVLSDDQEHLAAHFAGQRPSPSGPAFTFHDGLPFLDGALAHLGCRVVDVHPAGDHVLWTGQVEHLYCQDGRPLLFYTGRFRTLEEIEQDSPE